MDNNMEYEYKMVIIYNKLHRTDVEKLQELYDGGWDFVDSVAQCVSIAGRYDETIFGSILYTLRKKKLTL